MANGQATFNLNIKTNADLAGIEQLKKALQDVRDIANDQSNMFDVSDINKMTSAANDLEVAFNAAFNPTLGITDLQKFNKVLAQNGTNINQIQNGLAIAGATGQEAFLHMTNQLLQMNTAVKQTNSFLEKMAKSFTNSLRYQVMNATIQQIGNSISEAYSYVKRLDASLNDIQIVSEKSSESMKEFARQANEAAKSLGASTTDYTDASLIYYQQGKLTKIA